MRATISKEFSFHAAHQLPHHDGQCARLHGHSYKLVVFARGEVRPVAEWPHAKEGMVLDFGDIKTAYKTMVEPQVEHQFLNETLKGLVPGGEQPVTTAEFMAGWMLKALHALVPQVFKVQLWETASSCAEVSLDDLD